MGLRNELKFDRDSVYAYTQCSEFVVPLLGWSHRSFRFGWGIPIGEQRRVLRFGGCRRLGGRWRCDWVGTRRWGFNVYRERVRRGGRRCRCSDWGRYSSSLSLCEWHIFVESIGEFAKAAALRGLFLYCWWVAEGDLLLAIGRWQRCARCWFWFPASRVLIPVKLIVWRRSNLVRRLIWQGGGRERSVRMYWWDGFWLTNRCLINRRHRHFNSRPLGIVNGLHRLLSACHDVLVGALAIFSKFLEEIWLFGLIGRFVFLLAKIQKVFLPSQGYLYSRSWLSK